MDKNTLATTDDLALLKTDLVKDFKNLITDALESVPTKRWLKSADIKKILGISHGFLQALRDDGILPYTKKGGAIYYDYQDIIQMMIKYKNQ